MGCARSPRVAHVYRVVAAVAFACMVYRLSCPRWVMRMFGGCQFVHLGGVGEVAGDDDLGSVLLARGGVWNYVVGCPFVVGGFPCCVQF